MPGIGHFAVGMAATRVTNPPDRVSLSAWMGILVGAAYLPDIDVLAFAFGIPYDAPFGHRGALHSPAVAVLCAALLGAIAWCFRVRPLRIVAVAALVMASHGLLDAFTDGGRGVAFLWPLSNTRYFAPWRPLPVSPLGVHAFSVGGLKFMLNEAVLFLPLFLVALWPSGSRGRDRASGPTTG
jgi:inner membrane protein